MVDHWWVEEMLKVLKPRMSEETFNELCQRYINRVPNYFHADVPHEVFKLYKANMNQQNIGHHPELVRNQVIKEEADQSFAFEKQLTNYMPH
jgi:hypothetical protein